MNSACPALPPTLSLSAEEMCSKSFKGFEKGCGGGSRELELALPARLESSCFGMHVQSNYFLHVRCWQGVGQRKQGVGQRKQGWKTFQTAANSVGFDHATWPAEASPPLVQVKCSTGLFGTTLRMRVPLGVCGRPQGKHFGPEHLPRGWAPKVGCLHLAHMACCCALSGCTWLWPALLCALWAAMPRPGTKHALRHCSAQCHQLL